MPWGGETARRHLPAPTPTGCSCLGRSTPRSWMSSLVICNTEVPPAAPRRSCGTEMEIHVECLQVSDIDDCWQLLTHMNSPFLLSPCQSKSFVSRRGRDEGNGSEPVQGVAPRGSFAQSASLAASPLPHPPNSCCHCSPTLLLKSSSPPPSRKPAHTRA